MFYHFTIPLSYFCDMEDSIHLFPILGEPAKKEKWLKIDLAQPKILQKVNEPALDYLYRVLDHHNAFKNGVILYGGYLEKRIYYSQSSHFKNDAENRNIHIGIDIWAVASTNIYAPCDLTIHSIKYNDNYLDYGGTIIARTDDGIHLLFGHVSKGSLQALEVNQKVLKGNIIACLGDEAENGGWPPHLHFQLIKDMGDFYGDYPGVVSEKDIDFYTSNCPDPSKYIAEVS